MKSNYFLLQILLLCLVFSCSKDSVQEEASWNQDASLIEEKRNPPGDCFITGAMVNGETSYTGAPYTVYASSGRSTVNYDRRVTITLMDYVENLLLAQRHVTIRANENVSENAAINVNICNENITAVVTEVRDMTDFSIDASCVWRNTGTYSMNTCVEDPDVPCSVPGYGPCDQNPFHNNDED